MKSYSFLFWGYNVIWAGLALFLLVLLARLRRVARRLDTLERSLATSGDRARNQESSHSR